MNDAMKALERQLELATAREGGREAELDPETARLRDAWTQFGRLLETALPPQEPGFEARPARPASRSRRRLVTAVVAVAASLLVGVAATWMWWAARPVGQPVASSQQAVESIAEAPAQGPAAQPGGLASASGPQWDDSFDEQLAQLGQQMIRVEQDWASQAVASAVMQYQLEQVRQDVTGNNL